MISISTFSPNFRSRFICFIPQKLKIQPGQEGQLKPPIPQTICVCCIWKVLEFDVNVFKGLNEVVIDSWFKPFLLFHCPLERRRRLDPPYPWNYMKSMHRLLCKCCKWFWILLWGIHLYCMMDCTMFFPQYCELLFYKALFHFS